jgi:crossover junction endodeoxyribonuclease RusA
VLPFEFVIEGPPVSQQARRRNRVRQWSGEVRSIAENYWPVGAPPVTVPIMLTITYFYDSVLVYVDNIPKPILDALKGLVYLDDNQVTDILCRR